MTPAQEPGQPSGEGAATGSETEAAFTARARILPRHSSVATARGGFDLDLALSRALPFRVWTLDRPWRLVLDFSEADFTALDRAAMRALDPIRAVRAGPLRPGWSRMVLELTTPLAIDRVWMDTRPPTANDSNTSPNTATTTGRASGGIRSAGALPDVAAVLRLRMRPTSAAEFSETAGVPDGIYAGEARSGILSPAAPMTRQTGARALMVVLDPGHGGVDPGAQRDGFIEADLMLTFARVLREELIRAGSFDVVLTRNDNSFVSLEGRISIARAARADVLISLHADAILEGHATGATAYTLSEAASDEATALLAERHDREDLLAGVDLGRHDDQVATVLMDMARVETAPRSARLADRLLDAIGAHAGPLHKHPRGSGGFSVLKAPDIPSVLLELGYMSSAQDLERLKSAAWMAGTARALRIGLETWAREDAAEAILLRQ